MRYILSIRYNLIIVFTLITTFNIYAQKFPDKQKLGVHAPANVKIDGDPKELGSKFSAYNSATELFYTIANNDKILYLTLQANDPDVINRIVGGGITFTIVNKEVKNNKGLSFTYPIRSEHSISTFHLKAKNGQLLDTSFRASDSTMKANNRKLENLFRWIKVTGVKNLDTLSIYNEEGIKAAGKFDMKRNYTIEISIPMGLLLSELNKNTLSYQIRINDMTTPAIITKNMKVEVGDPAMADQVVEMYKAAADRINMMSGATTYFSGEYTLIK